MYDCTQRFVYFLASRASRYTGKERDAESGNDYFGLGAMQVHRSAGLLLAVRNAVNRDFEQLLVACLPKPVELA